MYTDLHTLPLRDALPISPVRRRARRKRLRRSSPPAQRPGCGASARLGPSGHIGAPAAQGRDVLRAGHRARFRDEALDAAAVGQRSEEHTSELQSLMRNSYAVFCLKKKKKKQYDTT